MHTTTAAAMAQQSQWGPGYNMESQSGGSSSGSPSVQRRGGQPADWRGNAYSGQFSAGQGGGQPVMGVGQMPLSQPAVFGTQPMYQGQPRPQQPGQATQDPFGNL
ncbi:uncharacterized protein [Amphiura filiformis]|uniref:uncharacterized protein isoform X1 n=1 Tax=Amphiura filiformis TaxID=82378 RepID=UPI003B20F733